ncbi:MAG: sensor histidine kinase KdpD [Bdellovibrionota bacterium]
MPSNPGEKRPDPDLLLAQIERAEEKRKVGSLKIYLGMSAGVGKTFAMLSDAAILKDRGVDVVAGYVEPHGRSDTDALARRFETIAPLETIHNGLTLNEFDLDAALARKPTLILVDELAHSNASSSRHAKRWQDVAELLESGIDVYTTVNIQHLESLKDVVSRITGTNVFETVPDSFISRASKVELIDIPPDELIQRLREGKVYSPEKVETALSNFFRQGNLMALRELVLRYVAERVDADMRLYRREKAVDDIWPTTERILVCVAPNTLSSRVVRAAARLAANLKGELIAVSIENSRYASLSTAQRHQAVRALAVAEDLSAEVVVREAEDIVGAILETARERNVTAIVIGKPPRKRWREMIFGSIVDDLIRRGGDISVHVIPGGITEGSPEPRDSRSAFGSVRGSIVAVGMTALITVVCTLAYPYLDLSNLIMLYLLGVAWVSTKRGQFEAILVALLSVVAFDFFFVPPRFTFAIQDAQYGITFAVMLVVALLISRLAQQLKRQTGAARERERRTGALYGLSRQLSSARDTAEIVAAASAHVRTLFHCETAIFLPDSAETLHVATPSRLGTESDPNERAVALWVRERGKAAGAGTDTLGAAKGRYIPLVFDKSVLGVLVLFLADPALSISERELLDAFTTLVAHTLHRVSLERESQEAQLKVEGEKLRSTLLSSVSHDLRTPLASIAGAASTLIEHSKLDEHTRTELAQTIFEESERLGRIVRNVLDVTRLETGKIELRLDWHSLEELVGSALRRTRPLLGERPICVSLPPELPLIRVDGTFLEQVFVNLLENAAKHTPRTAAVRISGSQSNDRIICDVSDEGPGLPAGDQSIFERSYGSQSGGGQGLGLGLTICRAIVAAHSGSISAETGPEGGATFHIELPLVSGPKSVVD